MAPVAGLFGKLPAHGDFVRRGWADATVDAIDRWLTETIANARAARGIDAFGLWMRAAPLWRGFVPAGRLGPQALHLGIAPSIDRAGRLFAVAAGVAAEATTAWRHATTAGGAVDAALYDALTGERDADAVVEAIAASIEQTPGTASDRATPAVSTWWLAFDGEPVIESGSVDASLLERLLSGGLR